MRGGECIASKFYRVMLCCSAQNNCSGLFILHLCIHRWLRDTRSAECRSQNQIRNFFRPGTCTLYCCVHVGKYYTNVNHKSTNENCAFIPKQTFFSPILKSHVPLPNSNLGILCNLDARESPYPPPSWLQTVSDQELASRRLHRKVRR